MKENINKRAFAKSSNVVAVKLADIVGRDLIIEQVKKIRHYF